MSDRMASKDMYTSSSDGARAMKQTREWRRYGAAAVGTKSTTAKKPFLNDVESAPLAVGSAMGNPWVESWLPSANIRTT